MPMARTLNIDGKSVELAIPPGMDRTERQRHLEALWPDQGVHLGPGLHLPGGLRVEDHLHRRRHPPLPRLIPAPNRLSYPEASKWRRNAIQGRLAALVKARELHGQDRP